MLSGLSSNSLIGKIRSIYGKRITSEDYRQLLKKTSVSEVCGYLKSNTHYADTLAPYNEGTIHRGQLEVLIERDIFEDYIRLKRFDDIIAGTHIFSYLTKRLEIREILYCIQLINAEKSEEYISLLPSYFIKHASFDLVRMAKSGKFSELLESIKSTEYYKILKNAEVDENGRVDYSECEIMLYNEYYKNALENLIDGLPKSERSEITEMIKMNILIKDILIIYRMKNFYNSSFEEIDRHLIKTGVRDHFYNKLIKAQNKEEFFKQVKTIPMLKKYNLSSEGSFSEDAHRILYEIFSKKIRMSKRPFAVFYSLFSLLDFEKENLTNIIEGIRYGVPQKEIENLLIL